MVFRQLSTKTTGCRQKLSTALYFVINLSITDVEKDLFMKKECTGYVDNCQSLFSDRDRAEGFLLRRAVV